MDLNIARQPGQKATPEALVRAVKRADAILARMVAEETYLDGATAFTSPQRPAVPLANAATDLRLPTGVAAGAVMDTIEAHFKSRGALCHSLDATEATWPAELAAEMVRRGHRPVTCEVAVLMNYVPLAASPAVQVIPGRAAYGEVRSLLIAQAGALPGLSDASIIDQHVSAVMDQLDDSRLDVFLARIDRKPVGLASLLTLGNIGVVTDLFTVDAGEATLNTLASRLFDHCQRAQFEQVIVRLAETDAPARRPLFLSLGFRGVASYHRYVPA